MYTWRFYIFSSGSLYKLKGMVVILSYPFTEYIYTEDAGLPYFDRAAVIANGKW